MFPLPFRVLCVVRGSNPCRGRYSPRMSVVLRLALLASILVVSGCSIFRPKSNSRIVEGESPTIKYTSPESAGGRVGGR